MRVGISVLFFVLSALLAGNAVAESIEDMHRQSAFTYAKRKDWNEALAHARLAHSDVLVKYFTWEYLKDPESDASFENIMDFMRQNPDWPDKAALEKRAEVALMADNPSDEMLDEWFSKHPPQTNFVKLKLTHDPEALRMMIRSAWVTDNYDKATESKLIAKYHAILRPVDHQRRIDRLVWEGKEDEAKRLLKLLPANNQRLFLARMALADDKFFAPVALSRVPKSLRSDAGLLFDRIRWRARRNDRDGVRELLLSAPAEVPFPEKWWPYRDRQIREALGEGNVSLAERLLVRHGQKPGTYHYREAEWLKGWVALEFRGAAEKAYRIFETLAEKNESPAGKAMAAYWAGRASEKIAKGNPSRWYGEAAHYSTTFYGQLAGWELKKASGSPREHDIKAEVAPAGEERERFRRQELVRLVYELDKSGQGELAGRFITYLAQNAKTSGDAVMAVELGKDIRRIDFSVRAAKKALQRDIIALDYGWPLVTVPSNLGVEKSFVLALTRQESEFYPDAISSSGACGLMQLLPGTAKETAHKAGMAYAGDKLFDPQYNMTIGSLYLEKLIRKFDGSYVLAAAGYNAGPGRVQQWLGEFGYPGSDVRTVVNWIEKIPTPETRNYVEHVMENLEVYRFLANGKQPAEITIADDLKR